MARADDAELEGREKNRTSKDVMAGRSRGSSSDWEVAGCVDVMITATGQGTAGASQPILISWPPFVSAFRSFWPPKVAVDCQTLIFSASFYKIRLDKNHSKST
jgi:hypothetical protein